MNIEVKSLLLVLAASVALRAQAQAQTAPAASTPAPNSPSWSVTVTPAFASQYMFRGSRLQGESFQPTVQLDSGNLSLGVWSNFPIDDIVPGQSDPEIDPYGSYKFVVNDAFSVQPGFTWYTYVNAHESAGFYNHTFEPNIALNYTFSGLTLTPKFYYDIVLTGPTYELNAAYSVPLKNLGTELAFTGTVGSFKWTEFAPTSPDTKNWGDYWQVGVSLPFAITKESKLTLGWAYTEGRDNYLKQGSAPKTVNSLAVGRGVVTVSYVWTL